MVHDKAAVTMAYYNRKSYNYGLLNGVIFNDLG